VVGDVCDAQAVAEAMPEDCDAVVHFAAESHVDRSILSAEEFVRTNVLGTQVMLEVARHRGVKRFLHISTDEVGGDMPPDGWFKEDDPLVRAALMRRARRRPNCSCARRPILTE
jgi:dTDP-glucose 4,6-dehydratase